VLRTKPDSMSATGYSLDRIRDLACPILRLSTKILGPKGAARSNSPRKEALALTAT